MGPLPPLPAAAIVRLARLEPLGAPVLVLGGTMAADDSVAGNPERVAQNRADPFPDPESGSENRADPFPYPESGSENWPDPFVSPGLGSGDPTLGSPEERLTAECLGFDRQPAPLGIGEVKALAAKVLPEDPILLPQILDHILLAPIHPAGQGRQQKLKWKRVHRKGSSLLGQETDRKPRGGRS